VLEQKGEVGSHRRSERDDQSEDHEKAAGLEAVLVDGKAGARPLLPGLHRHDRPVG
jgi:hypothetical protein